MDRFGLTPRDWVNLTYRKPFPSSASDIETLVRGEFSSELVSKWHRVWREVLSLESTETQVLLLLQWATQQQESLGPDYLELANTLLTRKPSAIQVLTTLSANQRAQLILNTPYHYTLKALWRSYLPFILELSQEEPFTEEMLELVNLLLKKRTITCRELESWLDKQPGHPLPHCTRHLALDERVGQDVADLISSFVSE